MLLRAEVLQIEELRVEALPWTDGLRIEVLHAEALQIEALWAEASLRP